jgi:hypothetical protein
MTASWDGSGWQFRPESPLYGLVCHMMASPRWTAELCLDLWSEIESPGRPDQISRNPPDTRRTIDGYRVVSEFADRPHWSSRSDPREWRQ